MGKGAYMFVYNLDTNDQKVNGVTAQQCMYDHGDDGSNISLWNNQTIAPKSAVPQNGWKSPQYIEADGNILHGCATTQSTFTLGFANGATVKLNLQTDTIPVTESSQGNVVCSLNANSSLVAWSGQAGIGIMILPDPSTRPAQSDFIPPSPATWMNWLNTKTNGSFFEQPLNHVSLPASHDSGMYTTTKCTTLASATQTQTQTLDIGGQLNAGIRYFDLRPCVWDVNEQNSADDFYFGHFTSSVGGMGCLGQNMEKALQQVVDFIAANSDEVVILKFSHFVDAQYNSFPIALQQLMLTSVQQALDSQLYKGVQNEKLNGTNLGTIVQNGKRVICVFDDLDASLYNASTGILRFGDLSGTPASDSNLDIYDNYADSDNLSIMVADQIEKYTNFLGGTGNNAQKNGLFLFSYTLTQSTNDAVLSALGRGSVLKLAEYADQYAWTVVTSLLKGPSTQQPPNLVYMDAITDQNAISAAIYFNLQNSAYQ